MKKQKKKRLSLVVASLAGIGVLAGFGIEKAFAYTSIAGTIGRFISYDGSLDGTQLSIVGGDQYRIQKGPLDWGIKNANLDVAVKEDQFDFGSLPVYQFDDPSQETGIYGGHDLIGQDAANAIEAHVKSTNQANWPWMDYLINQSSIGVGLQGLLDHSVQDRPATNGQNWYPNSDIYAAAGYQSGTTIVTLEGSAPKYGPNARYLSVALPMIQDTEPTLTADTIDGTSTSDQVFVDPNQEVTIQADLHPGNNWTAPGHLVAFWKVDGEITPATFVQSGGSYDTQTTDGYPSSTVSMIDSNGNSQNWPVMGGIPAPDNKSFVAGSHYYVPTSEDADSAYSLSSKNVFTPNNIDGTDTIQLDAPNGVKEGDQGTLYLYFINAMHQYIAQQENVTFQSNASIQLTPASQTLTVKHSGNLTATLKGFPSNTKVTITDEGSKGTLGGQNTVNSTSSPFTTSAESDNPLTEDYIATAQLDGTTIKSNEAQIQWVPGYLTLSATINPNPTYPNTAETLIASYTSSSPITSATAYLPWNGQTIQLYSTGNNQYMGNFNAPSPGEYEVQVVMTNQDGITQSVNVSLDVLQPSNNNSDKWGLFPTSWTPIYEGMPQEEYPATQVDPLQSDYPDPVNYNEWPYYNVGQFTNQWTITGPGQFDSIDFTGYQSVMSSGSTFYTPMYLPRRLYTPGTYTVSVTSTTTLTYENWYWACGWWDEYGCGYWYQQPYWPTQTVTSSPHTTTFTVLPHFVTATASPITVQRGQVVKISSVAAPIPDNESNDSNVATMSGSVVPTTNLFPTDTNPGANPSDITQNWLGYWVADLPDGTYTFPIVATWHTPFGDRTKTTSVTVTIEGSEYYVVPNNTHTSQ